MRPNARKKFRPPICHALSQTKLSGVLRLSGSVFPSPAWMMARGGLPPELRPSLTPRCRSSQTSVPVQTQKRVVRLASIEML